MFPPSFHGNSGTVTAKPLGKLAKYQSTISLMRRLLRESIGHYRAPIAFAVVLMAIMGACTAFYAYLMGPPWSTTSSSTATK